MALEVSRTPCRYFTGRIHDPYYREIEVILHSFVDVGHVYLILHALSAHIDELYSL